MTTSDSESPAPLGGKSHSSCRRGTGDTCVGRVTSASRPSAYVTAGLVLVLCGEPVI